MEGPTVTPQGGISYSRKIQVRDYESAEASIWISFDLPKPDEMTDEEFSSHLISTARANYFAAKALVFEELGLEFTVTEGGIVQEVLKKNFGNVTEVTKASPPASPVAAVAAESSDLPSSPPFAADTDDKAQRTANKKWAMARWAAYPNEFWDNRESKRNPRSPDLKHKETGMAVWLS
jgi:hypothetical protein